MELDEKRLGLEILASSGPESSRLLTRVSAATNWKKTLEQYTTTGAEVPSSTDFVAKVAMYAAASKRIPVILGDQPMDRTLEKIGQALLSTNMFQDMQTLMTQEGIMAGNMFLFNGDRADGDGDALTVERLQSERIMADQFLEMYRTSIPNTLYKAFIEDRDQYMVEALMHHVKKEKFRTAFMVVGMGHVSGIERILENNFGFKKFSVETQG